MAHVIFYFQYVCEQKCHGGVNNYNVVTYDSPVINYCSVEDVPTEINFDVTPVENEGEELTGASMDDESTKYF